METMTEKEFIDNATKLLTEYNLTQEQADAIAHLTVILEKKQTCRESSLKYQEF